MGIYASQLLTNSQGILRVNVCPPDMPHDGIKCVYATINLYGQILKYRRHVANVFVLFTGWLGHLMNDNISITRATVPAIMVREGKRHKPEASDWLRASWSWKVTIEIREPDYNVRCYDRWGCCASAFALVVAIEPRQKQQWLRTRRAEWWWWLIWAWSEVISGQNCGLFGQYFR